MINLPISEKAWFLFEFVEREKKNKKKNSLTITWFAEAY